jgi:N4-gp56 family major capsid protein
MPLCRQFVDVRPERVTHRGQSVDIQLNSYFTRADVIAAATPLGEETDVTPTKLPPTEKVTLTPTEYGFANVRTLKLKNRGMVDIDPVIGRAVGVHAGETIDYLLQTQMRTATNVIFGSSAGTPATADNQITDAHTLAAKDVRTGVTRLRGTAVAPRDGEYYILVAHPVVVMDLRTESGEAAWRAPNVYGTSQSDIWRGEIGAFEGARVVQSPTLLWGDVDTEGDGADRDGADKDGGGAGTVLHYVYRSFLLGREALAEAVVTEPHTVMSPQTDLLRRNTGLGWYGDLAFKVFRQQAIYQLKHGSSLDA